MGVFQAIFLFLRAFLMGRAAAAVENLALRQQVAVYKQSVKRPKLRPRDRFFWVLLSRLWANWRSALAIVQPETVIKWHRQGFKLYWRWKSRGGKPGRPCIERALRDLIRRMSRENPLWGAANSVGTAPVGLPRCGRDRGQVHGPHQEASLSALANVPCQSCSRVTDHPYAEWAARQIIDAFPYDQAPRFLLRTGTASTETTSRSASRTWASRKC